MTESPDQTLARVVDIPRAGAPDAGVTFRAVLAGMTELQRKQEHLVSLVAKLVQNLGARPPLLKVTPRPQPSASAPVFTQQAHALIQMNHTVEAAIANVEAALETLK